MSHHGLTSEEVKQQHATEIAKSTTFAPHGVSEKAPIAYLRTPEGKLYWQRLLEADPNAPIDKLSGRAIEQLTSGRDLPRMETISEPLVKIVPAGDKVTSYTPYFAKLSEFEDALAKGHNLNDRFGLPLKSEAPVYDVYEIRPKAPTDGSLAGGAASQRRAI